MTWAARLAWLPFRLVVRRPWRPPEKVVILKPCCLSQVMLATPLLAVLSEGFPEAQFDWAVSAWARPAVATNPRVSEILSTGSVGLPGASQAEVRALIVALRAGAYDTAVIPSQSSLLAYVAWRAGIPQRIGLDVGLRGFAHTIAVRPPRALRHAAERYLLLAQAVGLEGRSPMEFSCSDADRAAVSDCLVREVDWLGDRPLVIIHPGGGRNPLRTDTEKQWPPERFALLGNYLARHHGAAVVLVGGVEDRAQVELVRGLMTQKVTDLSGRLNLGELAAMAEIADLYVGNDAGTTHVAASVRCPTIAIFGPSNPAISRAYAAPARAIVLTPARMTEPFSWVHGPTYEEAVVAADLLLGSLATDSDSQTFQLEP
jgi:lipopolysaccharide heptosyltransferase II